MSRYRIPIANLANALPRFGQPPPRLRLASAGDDLRLVPCRQGDDEVVVDEQTGDLVRRAYIVTAWESDPDDPASMLCTVQEVTRPYDPDDTGPQGTGDNGMSRPR